VPIDKKSKSKNKKQKAKKNDARLDVVFEGPLLFVPEATGGNIGSVEMFAPCNGHHIGAVFLPGVIFTDSELDDPKCKHWPERESFSLLDPHSYTIELTQPGQTLQAPFSVTSIPDTNHKIKPGRRLSGDWDLSILIKGQISGWSTHRLSAVREGLFHGSDAPTGKTTASMQRLTYANVTAADLLGAQREQRAYLRENAGKGGTLIVIGEIPYQATLLHERQAVDAIAKLAGLDFHLAETRPKPFHTRLMDHTLQNCGASIVLA